MSKKRGGSFLDDYEPVEDRLAKFWADHPDGRVITDLVQNSEGVFIVKAHIHKDGVIVDATGYAREEIQASGVNRTSALENCETSAIGRALANLGYAAKGRRASREEMTKVAQSDVPADSEEGRMRHMWQLMSDLTLLAGGNKDYARQLWQEAASTFGLSVGDVPDEAQQTVDIYMNAVAALQEAKKITRESAPKGEVPEDQQTFEVETADAD